MSHLKPHLEAKVKQWSGPFDYAYGSAGISSTHHANLAAFLSLRIVPRILVPTDTRFLSTSLRRLIPLSHHHCSPRRTLRQRSYLPFGLGVGVEIFRMDPVFMKMHKRSAADPYDNNAPGDGGKERETRIREQKAWLGKANTELYRSWEDLDFILCGEDGGFVEGEREGGIVVSNYGGSQVDGALPSVVTLERILKSKLQAARQPASGVTSFSRPSLTCSSSCLLLA
ncbi:hypothetical protein D9758_015814 [Tetrapyrgos nigripes]|uniref:Uncharacterized protein n=1 Tax=Tetrapyrgos nigripes TaxID=182062 RepID=A0A8H5FKH1_9AGAR|nr:hypothetical protein D9758_015814 [Tetrapyrgos nigripes]